MVAVITASVKDIFFPLKCPPLAHILMLLHRYATFYERFP